MEIKFSTVKWLSSRFCVAKVERSQKAWRGYELLFHPESFCYLPDISCDRLHSPEMPRQFTTLSLLCCAER